MHEDTCIAVLGLCWAHHFVPLSMHKMLLSGVKMSNKFHQGVLTIIIMGVKLICRRTIKYVAFRASSYEPGWPGWLGYRDEFCLGFVWEILDRFPRWEKVKDPGDEFWCQIQEQSKHGETQNFNFRAYLSIGNSESCITAVKWDAYDVENTGDKKDDAIWTARIHPAVHSVNRDEVFIWQNFQPAYRDLGWKNRDLGNQASPPSHMNTSKLLQRL